MVTEKKQTNKQTIWFNLKPTLMYHVLFALYTELENPAPQYQLHSLNEWDSQVTAKAFYFTVSQNNRVHLVLISVLRKHVKQKSIVAQQPL